MKNRTVLILSVFILSCFLFISLQGSLGHTEKPKIINNSYTISDINPESGNVTIDIEVKFRSNQSGTLAVENSDEDVNGRVLNTTSTHIRFQNTDSINILYEISISDDKTQFVKNNYSFIKIPDIHIEFDGTNKETDLIADEIYRPSGYRIAHANNILVISNTTENYNSWSYRTTKESRSYQVHNLGGDNISNEYIKVAVDGLESRFQFKSTGNLDIIITGNHGMYYNGIIHNREKENASIIIKKAYLNKSSYGVEESTLQHELAHSVQRHRVSNDMKWWIEGSANYIGGLLSYETNPDYSRSDFRNDALRLDEVENNVGVTDSTIIADQNTMDQGYNYILGSRLVYLIDYELRSNSNKDIINVVKWMNSQDERITYKMFRDYITEHTGDQFGRDLDQIVHETDTIMNEEFLKSYYKKDEIIIPDQTFEK